MKETNISRQKAAEEFNKKQSPDTEAIVQKLPVKEDAADRVMREVLEEHRAEKEFKKTGIVGESLPQGDQLAKQMDAASASYAAEHLEASAGTEEQTVPMRNSADEVLEQVLRETEEKEKGNVA